MTQLAANTTSGLTIGDQAPDFSCPSTNGNTVKLSDLRGKYVVLYFYPKDDTPGCTTEAKDFTEAEAAFMAANAVILGISKDSIKSHDKFREKYCLPFQLLSDIDGAVCEAYNTWVEKSMYGKKYMGIERSTFLIDPQGKLKKIWRKVSVTNHVKDVLEAVTA